MTKAGLGSFLHEISIKERRERIKTIATFGQIPPTVGVKKIRRDLFRLYFIYVAISVCTVMRDLGAHAGTNVEAQGICIVTSRLFEDDLVPEMAEDSCPAG